MSEIVVYEDSPMAEYLQSVDKPETTVKVAPLNLTNNKTNDSSIRKRPSISRMWRHSIFHDAFSISLPKTEEAAFEEKFKYLVVTSPLLNEVLTFHHNKQRHRFTEHLTFQTNGATKLGVTTNLVATLMLLFGVERYTLRPRIPLMTLTCSTSASLFYIYRHKRRSSIRQLYQSILSKLQSFIEQCDTFDTKVQRVLITIQEIELVSRGYRLSTPLSPISRIEQNSKQRKCVHLRSRLASILRRAFIVNGKEIWNLFSAATKSFQSALAIESKNLRILNKMGDLSLLRAKLPLPVAERNRLQLLKNAEFYYKHAVEVNKEVLTSGYIGWAMSEWALEEWADVKEKKENALKIIQVWIKRGGSGSLFRSLAEDNDVWDEEFVQFIIEHFFNEGDSEEEESE
ncbi:hypothetical protein RMATCC62417_14512 [Rhizopus microsporus]|nr:hypothetical protein RMATCC62417_14512 [Rhizopus microsporus]